MGCIVFLGLLLAIPAKGAIKFEDAIFPELATGGRALAIGNAYTAISNDASSAFYNPAGLGTVRFPHIHLSNIHLEFNKGWLNLTTEGAGEDYYENFPEGFSLDGLRGLLQKKPGRIASSRFHAIPNITMRYLSLGYLVSKHTRTALGKGQNDLFEYASRFDHGPYGALNLSLFGGVFKVGASVTHLRRKEVFGEASASEKLPDDDDLPYKKGSSTHVVAGAKLTLPTPWLPTFSGTLHNAASDDFSAGTSAGPPEIKQTTVVGLSLSPQVGKLVRIHLAVDYKDLSKQHKDIENTRRWAGGAEFDIARKFFLRFGYGDGYGSGGLGIKSRKLEFDLTTYAVDRTSKSWRGKEDRRFSMTISSGF